MYVSPKISSFNGCLFQFLVAILGIFFLFIIFSFFFAGDQRAAVITEILLVLSAFIISFLLSFNLGKSWYLWSLSMSLPMIGLVLFISLGLSGNKKAWNDIYILLLPCFFVLISSLSGGYLGKIRKRKSEKDKLLNIDLPSTDKSLQCIYINKQGQVDIYITHHEQLPVYIQLIDFHGNVLSAEQTQTINGTVKVSINITEFLNRVCYIRVFNSDGINVQKISDLSSGIEFR